MRTSHGQSSGIPVGAADWRIPALLDRALATYVDWHRTTAAVADTYARWSAAPAVEHAVRYAAYMAALDQEQAAAAVHGDSISELRRWLRDSGCDRG